MKKILYLLCLFALNANAQTKNSALNTFLEHSQVKPATVAFQLYNVSTLKEIVSYNTNKLMVPASLQKLVTTSTFLQLYEPSASFETHVLFKGKVIDHRFVGIINIKASGDPSINETFVDEICAFIKQKNIDIIEGYIVVDEKIFDKQAPKTWLVEDVANYYGATAFGFNYLKNTYKLSLQQTDEGSVPKIISTTPYMRHLVFDNQLISGKKNSGDNAYFLGMPFSNQRQIVGSIPSGTGTFTIKGAINNPAQIFKNDLIKKFQELQIGLVFNPSINTQDTVFRYIHKSESYFELVKECNFKSINLYAEVFLKMIGKSKQNKHTENGIETIVSQYDNEIVSIYDGSGLSRKNLITAQFLTDVLIKNNKKSFTNTLSISGDSGTMKYFKSDKTKGKIKGKSGSADGILNYAGYFTNSKGEKFIFVLMVNNYTGKRTELRKQMVKLIEEFL